jgi:hypothetical protein
VEAGEITESHLADWINESYALKGETLTASELATKVGKMKTEILAGKDRLTDFTWHHHQELGRMELIPDWIHEKARHTGGDTLWPRNPSMKGK